MPKTAAPPGILWFPEYLAAKAAQLNSIQYEDKTTWTQADVLQAFKDANITAWDHYTTTGQQEGINPSNAFDNDAFFTAKCAILNAWQNEDGTVGYEGKDDWTKTTSSPFSRASASTRS